MIGDNVEVTVLEIKGGQVRLGINAPNNFCTEVKFTKKPSKSELRP